MTQTQSSALTESASKVLAPTMLTSWPWTSAPAPILEIGFGMGEATLELARRTPDLPHIAVDVHTPGIGNLLAGINRLSLTNITVVDGDADHVIRECVPSASLRGVRLFFPDPWPKARHHKRRFVSPERMRLLADLVTIGGFFHLATDWDDYAHHARDVIDGSDQWIVVDAVEDADPTTRPRTRFENRGIAAGRTITDIVAVRR